MNKLLIPAIAFFVLLLGSLLSYSVSQHYVDDDKEAGFEKISEKIRQDIKERITTYENMLRATKGFYDSSVFVDRNEWTIFSQNAFSERSIEGIQGMFFTKYLRWEELDTFLNETRQEIPDFIIFPTVDKEDYAIVLYTEPFSILTPAQGFNTYSTSERREALDYARDTGEIALTSPLTLITDKNHESGFLLVQAIYKNLPKRPTVQDRRETLYGFVAIPFTMTSLIEASLKEENANKELLEKVDIEVYIGDAQPENRIFHSDEIFFTLEDVPFRRTEAINLANKNWTFVISAEDFPSDQQYLSLITLIVGILISALLAFLLYTILTAHQHARSLAEKMTKDLKKSTEDLQVRNLAFSAATTGIVIMDAKRQNTPITYCNPAFEYMNGHSAESIIGKTLQGLLGLSQNDPDVLALELAKKEGKAWSGTVKTFRKDGTQRWSAFSLAPVPDEQGAVSNFVLFQNDVTDQKVAQESLLARTKELEEFQKLTIDRELKMIQLKKELEQAKTGSVQDHKP
ncbi:MAG: CHASE domain-containing protein [archaeon]